MFEQTRHLERKRKRKISITVRKSREILQRYNVYKKLFKCLIKNSVVTSVKYLTEIRNWSFLTTLVALIKIGILVSQQLCRFSTIRREREQSEVDVQTRESRNATRLLPDGVER